MPDTTRVTLGTGVGPIVTGPTTTIGTDAARGGPYQILVTDTYIRFNGGGACTMVLPTVASGLQDGQQIAIVSFDTAGDQVQIQPSPGDNIDGGSNFNLGNYGAMIVFKVRISGTVANWLIQGGSDLSTTIPFPLQPTLAAGAQGPISLGFILLPQGPRFLHSIWVMHDQPLTGGSSTITVTGIFAAATLTVSNGFQGNGVLYNPGNGNRLTVPVVGNNAGSLLQCTISTIAGFAGPTTVTACIRVWS